MRHSKRAKNRRKSSSSGTGHGWAWLLFGVVLGGILGSIGYIKWYESRPHTLPPIARASQKATKPPKPQFDFYTLLSEAKVEPPRSPGAPPQSKVPTAIAEASAKAHYRLQLAAFKSYHEADSMKAKLALSGFTLEIQSIKRDGITWYRVQTPPLQSQQEALQMQSALKAEAITSILIPG